MDFLQSKTKENLARAFAAECQDGARYQFIAKFAVSQGYSAISDQLKLLAKNEMAHASRLYGFMVEKLGTKESNVSIEAGYPFEECALPQGLYAAAEIESYEAKNIYPTFAKVAKDEGFTDIAECFTLVARIEEEHHQKLLTLANLFKSGKLYKRAEKVLWTCSNCGHAELLKSAWTKCPMCTYPQGYIQISYPEQN